MADHPEITDEIRDAVAKDLAYRGFFSWLLSNGRNPIWSDRSPEQEIARVVLLVAGPLLWQAWVAGRGVVDLPKSVEGVWPVAKSASVEALPPNADDRTVIIRERAGWHVGVSAEDARQLAAAVLAAADRADGLASESRKGGESR